MWYLQYCTCQHATAQPQPYPTRPVSLKLGDALEQSFLVDNSPSAGALIGLDILSSSAPDGHTLMMIGGSNVIYPM